MADELFEVPLFPLNVVLFPGMALPLHIFEPRYRDMMADCLSDGAPFGVALALPGSALGSEQPARVGTLARIADYEKLPDGRYNLLARGTRRFELIEVRREKSYLTGLVRPFDDVEDLTPDVPALVADAEAALHDYLDVVLTLLGSKDQELEIPSDPKDLSFLIGMCLASEDEDKQRLLELTSAPQRLREGTLMLRDEIETLERQIERGVRLAPGSDDSVSRDMLN